MFAIISLTVALAGCSQVRRQRIPGCHPYSFTGISTYAADEGNLHDQRSRRSKFLGRYLQLVLQRDGIPE